MALMKEIKEDLKNGEMYNIRRLNIVTSPVVHW